MILTNDSIATKREIRVKSEPPSKRREVETSPNPPEDVTSTGTNPINNTDMRYWKKLTVKEIIKMLAKKDNSKNWEKYKKRELLDIIEVNIQMNNWISPESSSAAASSSTAPSRQLTLSVPIPISQSKRQVPPSLPPPPSNTTLRGRSRSNPASAAAARIGSSSSSSGPEITHVGLDRNTGISYWEQKSANELRVEIQRRVNSLDTRWRFKQKQGLLKMIKQMITDGTW